MQQTDLMDYIVREVGQLPHVDAVALITPDAAGTALTFSAVYGWRNDLAACSIIPMPNSEFNLVGQVMRSQQPFLAEDIDSTCCRSTRWTGC